MRASVAPCKLFRASSKIYHTEMRIALGAGRQRTPSLLFHRVGSMGAPPIGVIASLFLLGPVGHAVTDVVQLVSLVSEVR